MLISLEISISFEDSHLQLDFVQLQKGSQIMPTPLAWVYFERELKTLRGLESYAGGIVSMQWEQSLSGSPYVMYRYKDRSIL